MVKTLILFTLILGFIACKHDYFPKPIGYFRIDLPPKKFKVFKSECNFKFEYPDYFTVTKSEQNNAEPCWYNLNSNKFNAKIHLSYKNINNNINELFEECRTLVYKHDIKADAINETIYSDTLNKIYGTMFEIKGNAASNIQFYVTDNAKNFIRGALYFEVKPNKDSLAPVINFIKKDVVHFIETIRWQ